MSKDGKTHPSAGGLGYPLWKRREVLATFDSLHDGTVEERVQQTAQQHAVSTRSVYRFRVLRAVSADHEPQRQPLAGRRPAVIEGPLDALLLIYSVVYPESYDDEYAAVLSNLSGTEITVAMVRSAFKRNTLTLKVLHRIASEQDPVSIELFHVEPPVRGGHFGVPLDDLLDVDESHVTLSKCGRKKGRAIVGQPAVLIEPYRRTTKANICLAVGVRGVVAFWIYKRNTNEDTFCEYLEMFLFPKLATPKVIMMDNLSVHNTPEVRSTFAHSPHTQLFRPEYAPQIAPVEYYFRLLHDIVRRKRRQFNDTNFLQMLKLCVDELPRDAIGIWRHCGY